MAHRRRDCPVRTAPPAEGLPAEGLTGGGPSGGGPHGRWPNRRWPYPAGKPPRVVGPTSGRPALRAVAPPAERLTGGDPIGGGQTGGGQTGGGPHGRWPYPAEASRSVGSPGQGLTVGGPTSVAQPAVRIPVGPHGRWAPPAEGRPALPGTVHAVTVVPSVPCLPKRPGLIDRSPVPAPLSRRQRASRIGQVTTRRDPTARKRAGPPARQICRPVRYVGPSGVLAREICLSSDLLPGKPVGPSGPLARRTPASSPHRPPLPPTGPCPPGPAGPDHPVPRPLDRPNLATPFHGRWTSQT
ncbi:hypothetical protein EV567_1032 [Streptomyces sp. BK239]|nr:hypothetical protein EV567_1032 [Streptomyces sp. BK239]